tara:strand:+ start:735 stop:1100 length:366 start_codon:yes stop_codon:yes gene_type:complete
MEITGTIKQIGQTQEFGAKGFTKRELVVITKDKYPQNILVEFVKDKCSLLDNYNTGDYIKVFINLRGREWTNDKGQVKYFNSIQGWKIQYNNEVTLQDQNQERESYPVPKDNKQLENDLPF